MSLRERLSERVDQALAVVLLLLAVGTALIARLILADLRHPGDNSTVGLLITGVPIALLAAMLLTTAMSAIRQIRHPAWSRRVVAGTTVTTVMPFSSVLGSGAIAINAAALLITLAILRLAWSRGRASSRARLVDDP